MMSEERCRCDYCLGRIQDEADIRDGARDGAADGAADRENGLPSDPGAPCDGEGSLYDVAYAEAYVKAYG